RKSRAGRASSRRPYLISANAVIAVGSLAGDCRGSYPQTGRLAMRVSNSFQQSIKSATPARWSKQIRGTEKHSLPWRCELGLHPRNCRQLQAMLAWGAVALAAYVHVGNALMTPTMAKLDFPPRTEPTWTLVSQAGGATFALSRLPAILGRRAGVDICIPQPSV